ncbi:hypothetical protein [Xenorhabdus thuongxuanensis]|uniref:Uncharacterized protein n=1 Tax=Xenorhabdus thuongxuanensis TaxID=1873484 RepID=A0A1Q5U4Z2_9GAMM|nr:hypothetical protein [Xenorhabdus thuongxuanensis]OKP07542.1 hypothetical protein Xentx_01298 [Xenorhabdus thuongxuanensis]
MIKEIRELLRKQDMIEFLSTQVDWVAIQFMSKESIEWKRLEKIKNSIRKV